MKYYQAFCIITKKKNSGYNMKSEILSILYYQKKIISGYNIRMLQITIDNCHKCDLETINDPSNSQYFGLIEEV